MLTTLLTQYGFTENSQHLDIIKLLRLAGCFDESVLQADLRAVGCDDAQIQQVLAVVQHNIEPWNPSNILDNLANAIQADTTKTEWPRTLHHWLLRVTQREFFARPAGVERWQQATGAWMTANESAIRQIMANLALEKQILPKRTEYSAVAVFGSTSNEMAKRLSFIRDLIDTQQLNTSQLYLLCGERPATAIVDGGEMHLQTVAETANIPVSDVTETHLMQYAYDQEKGDSIFADLPVTIIDTPKGSKPRPTTVDTLVELAKVAPALTGDVLFISRAPNILPQREDTLLVLQQYLPQVVSEVIGDKCENTALNRLIGVIGGTLFGGYPRVARTLGCECTIEQLEAERNTFTIAKQQEATKHQQSEQVNVHALVEFSMLKSSTAAGLSQLADPESSCSPPNPIFPTACK
jgi:hypothetical protein